MAKRDLYDDEPEFDLDPSSLTLVTSWLRTPTRQSQAYVGMSFPVNTRLQPRQFTEFEPTCRYHQTSPDSHFTQRRICTLATPQGPITLAEKRLIVTQDGQRQERPVEPDEYDALLESRFGIKLEV